MVLSVVRKVTLWAKEPEDRVVKDRPETWKLEKSSYNFTSWLELNPTLEVD